MNLITKFLSSAIDALHSSIIGTTTSTCGTNQETNEFITSGWPFQRGAHSYLETCSHQQFYQSRVLPAKPEELFSCQPQVTTYRSATPVLSMIYRQTSRQPRRSGSCQITPNSNTKTRSSEVCQDIENWPYVRILDSDLHSTTESTESTSWLSWCERRSFLFLTGHPAARCFTKTMWLPPFPHAGWRELCQLLRCYELPPKYDTLPYQVGSNLHEEFTTDLFWVFFRQYPQKLPALKKVVLRFTPAKTRYIDDGASKRIINGIRSLFYKPKLLSLELYDRGTAAHNQLGVDQNIIHKHWPSKTSIITNLKLQNCSLTLPLLATSSRKNTTRVSKTSSPVPSRY